MLEKVKKIDMEGVVRRWTELLIFSIKCLLEVKQNEAVKQNVDFKDRLKERWNKVEK